MGSVTAGVDGMTINDIKLLLTDEMIEKVRSMFFWYQPQAVRRVFIPNLMVKRDLLGYRQYGIGYFNSVSYKFSNLYVKQSFMPIVMGFVLTEVHIMR